MKRSLPIKVPLSRLFFILFDFKRASGIGYLLRAYDYLDEQYQALKLTPQWKIRQDVLDAQQILLNKIEELFND
jgi:hypothetical protein